MNSAKKHHRNIIIMIAYGALYARGEYNNRQQTQYMSTIKKDIQDSLNLKVDSKMELLQRGSDAIIHKKLQVINDKVDTQMQAKLAYYDTIHSYKN